MPKRIKRELIFTKQQNDNWIRKEKNSKKHVNEEAMFREIATLIDEGWIVDYFGITHVIKIRVISP